MLVSSLGDGSIVNSLDCPSLWDVSSEDIHVKVACDNWCIGDMVWKGYGPGRGRVVASGGCTTNSSLKNHPGCAAEARVQV